MKIDEIEEDRGKRNGETSPFFKYSPGKGAAKD